MILDLLHTTRVHPGSSRFDRTTIFCNAGNTYTRSGEHLRILGARDINHSPLWRHCVEEHGEGTQQFGMSVTGSYRNDTDTSANIRSGTERPYRYRFTYERSIGQSGA